MISSNVLTQYHTACDGQIRWTVGQTDCDDAQ